MSRTPCHRRAIVAPGLAAAASLGLWITSDPAVGEAPPMSDFIGTNMHAGRLAQGLDPAGTPDLFRPVAGHVRLYHPITFDLARTSDATNFPKDQWNWLNWDTGAYGPLRDAGYQVDATIMFDAFGDLANPSKNWDDPTADAYAYGRAFAEHFGPTVGNGTVQAIQIGNEPVNTSNALYRTVFSAMSAGIRSVDPSIRIVSANVQVDSDSQYAKSVETIFNSTEMIEAVDVLAIHTYPHLRGWPTWEPSHPEDPRLNYLTEVRALLDWRDQHAPGKEVWVTEFGYGASTQEPDPNTEFKDWIDVTDTQQAQYLTRSYLLFAEMGVDRAYQYWYNDQDNPQLHGSSGLTRNFEPKPSYWAIAHLQGTLGDYRFSEVIRQDDEAYVFAFEHTDDPDQTIWVLWSPTGEGVEVEVTLEGLPGDVLSAERMPLADGPAPAVDFEMLASGGVRLTIGESPTYLHFHAPEPAGAAMMVVGGLAWLGRRGRDAR